MALIYNGSQINSLVWNGTETTGVWNGEVVWGDSSPSFKTLTLYHSEGGTLTANTLTGYPGDTINLSTAYNTYWRFSGYQLTGDGELVGNDYTFGDEDASICACYKVNAFTASGGWEKGSNKTTVASQSNTAPNTIIGPLYAITDYRTSNVPTAWYNNSNHWQPNGASGYEITLNPKAHTQIYAERNNSVTQSLAFVTVIGNTTSNLQTVTSNASNTTSHINYNETITSTSQTNYSISGYMKPRPRGTASRIYNATANYYAAQTSGTWAATGIAP